MSVLGTIAEGGQTWTHRVRMVHQVLRTAIFISLFVSALTFGVILSDVNKVYFQSFWFYNKAGITSSYQDKVSIQKQFWESVANEHYKSNNLEIPNKRVRQICKPYHDHFLKLVRSNLMDSLLAFAITFSSFICFFLIRGLLSKRQIHISGGKVSKPYLLSLRLRLKRQASSIRIGSVPLIKGTETQHILVSGGTGSGKTNCFNEILPQIREQKQKAIVVDVTGNFVKKYYREDKDFLMNPFDERGQKWHPWIECREDFDYDSIAESFIPLSNHEESDFWRRSSQAVFSSILQKMKNEKTNSTLSEMILKKPLDILCSYLDGTKAVSFLDPSSERTAASIRSVAASFLSCLDKLPDTKKPFSIRDWIQSEVNDSWLFLSTSFSQRATLTPLISSWLSIAIRSLLQMEPDLKRRVWFIVDELPSLHRLKDLETFVTESRKFGGCGLFSIQSPAQLDSVYGHQPARTIIGNTSTKVAFSEQDPEIAGNISKMFGYREIKELQKGISYGAHEMRDGINLSSHNKNKPLVSPTDVQSLDVNQAFLKLPGRYPITKIRVRY